MEIYLVRHTAVAIAKGICYGQTDIDVAPTFLSEAEIIKEYLPANINAVYSSPLKRCRILAEHLFQNHSIALHDKLMEINCGSWEMQAWNDIPRAEIDPWMQNHTTTRIPAGESYEDLYERVKEIFTMLHKLTGTNVIFTHGGVIRSILTHLTHTPLKDSFNAFSLNYGCVIKITNNNIGFQYEVLSNIEREKETHKPSY